MRKIVLVIALLAGTRARAIVQSTQEVDYSPLLVNMQWTATMVGSWTAASATLFAQLQAGVNATATATRESSMTLTAWTLGTATTFFQTLQVEQAIAQGATVYLFGNDGKAYFALLGDTANGLDVDVTRVQGTILSSSIGSTVYPSSGALWGIAGDMTGALKLGYLASTNYIGTGVVSGVSGNVLLAQMAKGLMSDASGAGLWVFLSSTNTARGNSLMVSLEASQIPINQADINGISVAANLSVTPTGTGNALFVAPFFNINNASARVTASATAFSYSGLTGFAQFVLDPATSASATLLQAVLAQLTNTIFSETSQGINCNILWTSGALSTTAAAQSAGAVFMGGCAFTASVRSAAGYGSTVFIVGSNADACPATNDPTAWRSMVGSGWVQQQPGALGPFDPNVLDFKGVRWVMVQLGATPISAVTVLIARTRQ